MREIIVNKLIPITVKIVGKNNTTKGKPYVNMDYLAIVDDGRDRYKPMILSKMYEYLDDDIQEDCIALLDFSEESCSVNFKLLNSALGNILDKNILSGSYCASVDSEFVYVIAADNNNIRFKLPLYIYSQLTYFDNYIENELTAEDEEEIARVIFSGTIATVYTRFFEIAEIEEIIKITGTDLDDSNIDLPPVCNSVSGFFKVKSTTGESVYLKADFALSDEISSEKFKDTFEDIAEEYNNHKEKSYVSSYTCGYVTISTNKYIMIYTTGSSSDGIKNGNQLFLLSDKVMQDLSEKINNM